MNFTDCLSRHARERPDAVAIVEGDQSVSYAAFDAAVSRAAAWFGVRGVAPGNVVAISLPSWSLHLVAAYGLMRMGAVIVGLGPAEPKETREPLARRLGVVAVVALDDSLALEGCALLRPDMGWLAGDAPIPAIPRFEGDDRPLLIWRSSGTTAASKGVVYTHRRALRAELRQATHYPTGNRDRYLSCLDLSLKFGLSACMHTILVGGTVVLVPLAITPTDFLEAIDRYRINRLALVPSLVEAVVPVLPADRCGCPGVLDLTVSGMATRHSLRQTLWQRMTPHVLIKYGTNEVGTIAIADRALQEQYPETVGRVADNIDVEIVDDEDRPVEPGEVGVVRVRGEWMPNEYVNNPEATAKAFRNGWFYPGDLAVMTDDRVLFLKGRVDDLMNCDGIKIMPSDIEDVLLAHPAVLEAAAFPLQSEAHQNIPAAVVVLREPVPITVLYEYCREKLGARGPSALFAAERLPKNAMGKVLKTALAAELTELMSRQANSGVGLSSSG